MTGSLTERRKSGAARQGNTAPATSTDTSQYDDNHLEKLERVDHFRKRLAW